MMTNKSTRKISIMVMALVGIVVLSACGNLRNQPSYRAYERSEVFGNSAWVTDENAVAQGLLYEDEHLYNGTINGELADTFPFEITEEILAEGERWYEGFCTPCHGYSGYGNGVVRIEGYPVQPLNHHTDAARSAPVGAYFQVITYGSDSGLMWPIANRIPPEQRWAIIAYIRALQVSQDADAIPSGIGQGGEADDA
ncbi:MAG: c-type cytochrome, partial [Chloroflexota bacterium]